MSAQKGSLVLIKIGDGGDPESFTTVGGLRTSRLALNNDTTDASNHDSGSWRRLLGSAGIRNITLSGAGLFTDAASEETLRGYAFSGTINNYQFVFANGDGITGPFVVAEYERRGDHDGEELYALTLASAGDITFNAA